MRFKTGFVVGCATGLYLDPQGRQFGTPSPGAGLSSHPAHSGCAERPQHATRDPRQGSLGDLARTRSGLLHGPVGKLARDRHYDSSRRQLPPNGQRQLEGPEHSTDGLSA